MKYFQYLNLDWEPVAYKLKEFVLNNKELVDYNTGSWKSMKLGHISHLMPDIVKMLRPLDVMPVKISFFMSYNTSTIHKDSTMHECRRILIPIMNCENTVTRFYKSNKEPAILYQPNGIPYYGDIDPSDCEFVDEYRLDRAVVIKSKELHSVICNNPNLPRISCPIEVNKDLYHLFN